MRPGDLVRLDHRIFGEDFHSGIDPRIGDPILVVTATREIMGSPYITLLNTHTGTEFVDKAENYARVDEDSSKDSP
jgi:hypothetical protein